MASLSQLLSIALWFGLITASPLSLFKRQTPTSRTAPPPGAVVVDQTGQYSDYTTVQSGVDALSTNATGLQSLFIYPGVYTEQVYIPPRAANLSVYGYTTDTSSYEGNTVNIQSRSHKHHERRPNGYCAGLEHKPESIQSEYS